MTTIKYVCTLINRHMQLSMIRNRNASENCELEWLSYKLKRVREAQKKVIYGIR